MLLTSTAVQLSVTVITILIRIGRTAVAIVIDYDQSYQGGGPSNVNIEGGTFISANNQAVSDNEREGNTTPHDTEVISGGSFTGAEGKDAYPSNYLTEGTPAPVDVNGTKYVGNDYTFVTTANELQTALNAGGKVVLKNDIAVEPTLTVPAGKTVELDLAGNKLSGNSYVEKVNNVKTEYPVVKVEATADLTVKNGTINLGGTDGWGIHNFGKMTVASDAVINSTVTNWYGAIKTQPGSTLDIYGTINADDYGVYTAGTSTANVYDGAKITVTRASAISGNGSTGLDGYTINVYGGELTSTTDVAIYHPNAGTLNITGGTITGATAIYVKAGTMTIGGAATSISNATIKGTGANTGYVYSGGGCNATGDAVVIDSCGYPGGAPDVNISSGNYISEHANAVASYTHANNDPKITEFVSGGTFNTPIASDYAANGFVPKKNSDGTYGVKTGTYVAEVNNVQYKTIEEAIAAANEGDTVTLLANCSATVNDTVTVDKTMIIDFNGKTFTNNSSDYAFTVNAGENKLVRMYSGTISGTGRGVKVEDKTELIFGLHNDKQMTVNTTGRALGIYTGAFVRLCSGSTLNTSVKGDVTVFISKNANFYVDGTVTQTCDEYHYDNNAISGNGNLNQHDGTYLEINPTAVVSSDTAPAIYQPQKGELNIKGGTITGPTAVYVKSGKVTITGGTITGTMDPADVYTYYGNGGIVTGDAVVIDNCNYPGGAPSANITGGTFVAEAKDAAPVASYSSKGSNANATDPGLVAGYVSGDAVANKAFAENVCKAGYVPAAKNATTGMYGVEQYILTGNADVKGYQRKANTKTDQGNDINTSGVRILTKIDNDFLSDASVTDYGYVVAKVAGKDQKFINFNNLYKDNDRVKTISCKGSVNYNLPEYNEENVTTQTYVTLAVNGMSEGDQVAVRFYVVKDGKTYYSKYVNSSTNSQYNGILATYTVPANS